MRIGLHTRGDPDLGMGHVFRCLVMRDIFAADFPDAETTFVVCEGELGVTLIRERHAGRLTVVPRDQAPIGSWDILVVDRLSSPIPFMAACRESSRCLVVLDDIGPGRWQADITVNALYHCPLPRPAAAKMLELDGLAYLVLNPAFGAASPRAVGGVRQILLTQGGSDTFGLVPPLAQALAGLAAAHPGVTIHAHTGPAFRFDEALETVIAAHGGIVRRHRDIADMAAFCASMDLAVAAGGVLACELAALGVPLVLVTGDEKELETMSVLAGAGAAVNLGLFGGDGAERVTQSVARLIDDSAGRAELSAASRRTVDGQGAARISAAIKDILEGAGS